MPPTPTNRRDFLIETGRTATASWLALSLPWLATLESCTAAHGSDDAPVTTLSANEKRTMGAFAAQILPADGDFPGAEALGASTFVDRALALPWFASLLPQVKQGLADLDQRARSRDANSSFADLKSDDQIALMTEIEKSEFFATARRLVILATFADPKYGGNQGHAGWALLHFEHANSYSAPFGYYDAVATGRVVAS